MNNNLASFTVTNAAGKAWMASCKEKLSSNFAWASKGLVAIFHKQTSHEQANQTTTDSNGVGFNGTDAMILTSLAQFFIRNGYLSAKQQAIMFRKMPKYAGQLLSIAQGKTDPVVTVPVAKHLKPSLREGDRVDGEHYGNLFDGTVLRVHASPAPGVDCVHIQLSKPMVKAPDDIRTGITVYVDQHGNFHGGHINLMDLIPAGQVKTIC